MAAETLPYKVELHEVPRIFFWGGGGGGGGGVSRCSGLLSSSGTQPD